MSIRWRVTGTRRRGQRSRKPLALAMAVIAVFLAWDAGHGWKWSGFGGKTLWNWLELLGALAIPIAVAVLGALFARRERERGEQRQQEDASKEERQRQAEREIADDRAREAVLETYLDRMTELLLDGGLGQSTEGARVRQVARARTLTTLRRLDGERKGVLLRFLYESELILATPNAVLSLSDADLSRANLTFASLDRADLRGAYLNEADLMGAHLKGANLIWTYLNSDNLMMAELGGAKLSNANLSGAELTFADLSGADLSGATVTDEQLAQALSLENATMPDGSKHA